MAKDRMIGQIIHPSWSYDLEASLRVHRMLVQRSLAKKWRFQGSYVITGPFETLMGHPCCGSSFGDTGWASLDLHVRDGFQEMTAVLNRRIFETMCQYPDFAGLNETIPDQTFIHCGDAVTRLADYERGRTLEAMNTHHKRATLVKNVRIECRDKGVWVSADVSFNTRPTESSWDLFWLDRTKPPKWNERRRLATWLTAAEESLAELVKTRENVKS